jgi:PKD repeat protein
MIPRLLRLVPVATTVAIVALLSSACQKVPLLAPSGSVITLTAAATALPLNGSTDILAQVLESAGTPPQDGTLITFTTTLGSFQPPEAETRGGRVTVKFLAGSQNGTATIVASSGGASASGNNALRIAIGAAAVGHVLIDANPGTVSANGGTSTITSVVFDINGNPLGGVQVAFSTDAGSISPAVVSADANGQAQATLTTNRTAKVTATAGNPATGGGTGTGTGTTTPTSAQTATVTVTVNTPAAISFGTITPSTPVAGQAVTFALTYGTATGVSPITRVVMDWGDGSPAQTFNGQPTAVSHTFSGAGSFLVRATATDSFGDVSTATTAVTVTAQPRPTVTISASANPTAGTATTFTIAATAPTGATITSVRVDFGDGTSVVLPGNTTSVQHPYATGGTYTVTAIATDSNGNSGSASTVIVVTGSGVTASFTVSPASGNTSTTFNFNAQDSSSPSGIASYVWDFGDNTSPGTGVSTTHKYNTSGTFTVRLTVTDNAGRTGTTSKTVTVS